MSSGLNIHISTLRQYIKEVEKNGKGYDQGVDDGDKAFLASMMIYDNSFAEAFVEMLSKAGCNLSEERAGLYQKLTPLINELKNEGFTPENLRYVMQKCINMMKNNPDGTLEDIVREMQKGIVEIQGFEGKLNGDIGELKKLLANYINGESLKNATLDSIVELCKNCGIEVQETSRPATRVVEFDLEGKHYQFISKKTRTTGALPPITQPTEGGRPIGRTIEEEEGGGGVPQLVYIDDFNSADSTGVENITVAATWTAEVIQGYGLEVPGRYFTNIAANYYKLNTDAIAEDFPGQDIKSLKALKEAIAEYEAKIDTLYDKYATPYTTVLDDANCPEDQYNTIMNGLKDAIKAYYKEFRDVGLFAHVKNVFERLIQEMDLKVNTPELLIWLNAHPDSTTLNEDDIAQLKTIYPDVQIKESFLNGTEIVTITDMKGVPHVYQTNTNKTEEINNIIQLFIEGKMPEGVFRRTMESNLKIHVNTTIQNDIYIITFEYNGSQFEVRCPLEEANDYGGENNWGVHWDSFQSDKLATDGLTTIEINTYFIPVAFIDGDPTGYVKNDTAWEGLEVTSYDDLLVKLGHKTAVEEPVALPTPETISALNEYIQKFIEGKMPEGVFRRTMKSNLKIHVNTTIQNDIYIITFEYNGSQFEVRCPLEEANDYGGENNWGVHWDSFQSDKLATDGLTTIEINTYFIPVAFIDGDPTGYVKNDTAWEGLEVTSYDDLLVKLGHKTAVEEPVAPPTPETISALNEYIQKFIEGKMPEGVFRRKLENEFNIKNYSFEISNDTYIYNFDYNNQHYEVRCDYKVANDGDYNNGDSGVTVDVIDQATYDSLPAELKALYTVVSDIEGVKQYGATKTAEFEELKGDILAFDRFRDEVTEGSGLNNDAAVAPKIGDFRNNFNAAVDQIKGKLEAQARTILGDKFSSHWSTILNDSIAEIVAKYKTNTTITIGEAINEFLKLVFDKMKNPGAPTPQELSEEVKDFIRLIDPQTELSENKGVGDDKNCTYVDNFEDKGDNINEISETLEVLREKLISVLKEKLGETFNEDEFTQIFNNTHNAVVQDYMYTEKVSVKTVVDDFIGRIYAQYSEKIKAAEAAKEAEEAAIAEAEAAAEAAEKEAQISPLRDAANVDASVNCANTYNNITSENIGSTVRLVLDDSGLKSRIKNYVVNTLYISESIFETLWAAATNLCIETFRDELANDKLEMPLSGRVVIEKFLEKLNDKIQEEKTKNLNGMKNAAETDKINAYSDVAINVDNSNRESAIRNILSDSGMKSRLHNKAKSLYTNMTDPKWEKLYNEAISQCVSSFSSASTITGAQVIDKFLEILNAKLHTTDFSETLDEIDLTKINGYENNETVEGATSLIEYFATLGSASDIAEEMTNKIKTELKAYIKAKWGINLTDSQLKNIIKNIVMNIFNSSPDNYELEKREGGIFSLVYYTVKYNVKNIVDKVIAALPQYIQENNPATKTYQKQYLLDNEFSSNDINNPNYFIKINDDEYKLNVNSSVFTEYLKKNGLITNLSDLRDAIKWLKDQKQCEACGLLADAVKDLGTRKVSTMRNGKEDMHTEFGMDANGNIVFEQTETKEIYEKMRSTLRAELIDRNSAAFDSLGEENFNKLVQAAWITTYNSYNSSQRHNCAEFITKVLENFEKILRAISKNPELLKVYTEHTNYADENLTTGLTHYGTDDTVGGDQKINYSGTPTTDSEGNIHLANATDDPDYQDTMADLRDRLYNKYDGKIDRATILKIFREAQKAALQAFNQNLEDCPYGTANGSVVTSGKSMEAKEGTDWAGTTAGRYYFYQELAVTMQEMVQMTLYYFDKLLYAELGKGYTNPDKQEEEVDITYSPNGAVPSDPTGNIGGTGGTDSTGGTDGTGSTSGTGGSGSASGVTQETLTSIGKDIKDNLWKGIGNEAGVTFGPSVDPDYTKEGSDAKKLYDTIINRLKSIIPANVQALLGENGIERLVQHFWQEIANAHISNGKTPLYYFSDIAGRLQTAFNDKSKLEEILGISITLDSGGVQSDPTGSH